MEILKRCVFVLAVLETFFTNTMFVMSLPIHSVEKNDCKGMSNNKLTPTDIDNPIVDYFCKNYPNSTLILMAKILSCLSPDNIPKIKRDEMRNRKKLIMFYEKNWNYMEPFILATSYLDDSEYSKEEIERLEKLVGPLSEEIKRIIEPKLFSSLDLMLPT